MRGAGPLECVRGGEERGGGEGSGGEGSIWGFTEAPPAVYHPRAGAGAGGGEETQPARPEGADDPAASLHHHSSTHRQ